MTNLTELFCDVDDFCKVFAHRFTQKQIGLGIRKRNRSSTMTPAEMMTILILFHQVGYRNFKQFYTHYVTCYLTTEFPRRLSYSRFVRLMPSVLMLLFFYLETLKDSVTGITYVDSTPLKVCHNKRIKRHHVFLGAARRGKTSMGWFYGFKLHLMVNERGGLLAYTITSGNTDDRAPVKKMAKKLWGKLFGDKGYLSKKLFDELFEQGITLITSIKKNMKNKFLKLQDKLLLRKRFIIETINDQLKNISQIEHTRHRSRFNFIVNVIGGLIAYARQPKKPSIYTQTLDPQRLLAIA